MKHDELNTTAAEVGELFADAIDEDAIDALSDAQVRELLAIFGEDGDE